MNKKQFLEAYKQHQKWLEDNTKGKRFELHTGLDFEFSWGFRAESNLSFANLSFANLSFANLSFANLSSADLSSANLRSADLRSADLRSANLDFSSGIGFSCKSKNIKADLRLAAQMALHFCWIDFGDCEDAKELQKAAIKLANQFHLIKSGDIEKIKEF